MQYFCCHRIFTISPVGIDSPFPYFLINNYIYSDCKFLMRQSGPEAEARNGKVGVVTVGVGDGAVRVGWEGVV